MKKHAIPPLLILAALAAAFYFRADLSPWGERTFADIRAQLTALTQRGATETGPLVASGAMEARTLSVSSPDGGKISRLYVSEGQEVEAGAQIAQLDTTLPDSRLAEAQAALAVAEAQIELLEAGVAPADLEVARAAVGQARAARDAARVAWQDAQDLIAAPAELDVSIAQARAAVAAAKEEQAAASAAATTADLEQAEWARVVKMLQEGFDVSPDFPGAPTFHVNAPSEKLSQAFLQWNLSSQKTWQAHAALDAAAAASDAARQRLTDLQAQKADPLQLQAQADAAEATYRSAEAAVATAEAGVKVMEAGATEEQLAAARALAEQARREIAAIQVERDRRAITAPQRGTVTSVVLHEGELAAAGAPIVRLSDLKKITLNVFVPEPDMGQVRVGDPVRIIVDAFPGRTFDGTVQRIADQAEFTPKNIQTQEERANTVFAVKIALPNAEGLLRPGMPADAYFGGTGAMPFVVAPVLAEQGKLEASGIIEAEEVAVSAELGGQIIETLVGEGDPVLPGQLLAVLDTSSLEARLREAEAAIVAAEAELAQAQAVAIPERVAQAQAQLDQARIALQGAEILREDARKLRANPQTLDAQINTAAAQIKTLASAIDLAQAQVKAAQVMQESLPDPGPAEDKARRAIYDQQALAAAAHLRAVQAQERGARDVLARLKAIRANPVALDAAVHTAESNVSLVRAALETAQAELARVQAAARPEAVALAEAKLARAQAVADTLRVTIAKRDAPSPVAGHVAEQVSYAGEVAQPGQTIYTVVDDAHPTLRIFVQADRLGEIALGQAADVMVDAYPDRTFRGSVTRISEEAEYTPRNIQTQEQRVKTVFAIELTLEDIEGLLRPGMPADAVLHPAP